MDHMRVLKAIVFGSMGLLCFLIAMEIIYPMLNRTFAADIVLQEMPAPTGQPEKPGEAEELLLTALYQREEDTGDFTAIYIEIFHTDTGRAFYMEVPVHTKVSLSMELYKKLQAYSPELPQDFKLAKMGEGFSENYCMTACNRILSEILGVAIEHYVCADKSSMETWKNTVTGWVAKEVTAAEFHCGYESWMEQTEADLTPMERWVYFESYRKLRPAEREMAPGADGLSEYLISTKLAQSRLQEWMHFVEE